MTELYAEIRLIHIVTVLASGGLFLVRGIALFAGAGWATARPVRILAYANDTVLLASALMLMPAVDQYPFVHAWLTAKVLLLVLYVILGIFAFRKARRSGERLAYWLAALAVYGFIISVAWTRDPLGVLGILAGN